MNNTTPFSSRTTPFLARTTVGLAPRTVAAAGACLAIAAAGLVAGASSASASTGAPHCDSDQYTVTSVVTANSAATICASYDDALEYRGLNRTTGDTLCIPVSEVHRQENGSGRYFFVAYNNGYKYSVFDGLGLSIVGPDGKLLSSEAAL